MRVYIDIRFEHMFTMYGVLCQSDVHVCILGLDLSLCLICMIYHVNSVL